MIVPPPASAATGSECFLNSGEEVKAAALRLRTSVLAHDADAVIEGYQVERMLPHPGAREVLIEVADDPIFGPVILFGHGGAAASLIGEIVPKGSIAIDGISLTVVDVAPAAGTFSVHVIPHTWGETALVSLAPGMRVNLESDLIGKYVRQTMTMETAAPLVTWDKLRDAGFLT